MAISKTYNITTYKNSICNILKSHNSSVECKKKILCIKNYRWSIDLSYDFLKFSKEPVCRVQEM